MKVKEALEEAFKKRGFQNIKESAKALGVSAELVRLILYHGHIPKDSTLTQVAEKLDLDASFLIIAAHQERVPPDVKGFFLTPAGGHIKPGKRKNPLSEEQCDYLAKIMSAGEIQLLRKVRQISDDAKMQVKGYVDFVFLNARKEKPERLPRV